MIGIYILFLALVFLAVLHGKSVAKAIGVMAIGIGLMIAYRRDRRRGNS